MMDAIKHRGPDASGYIAESGLFFGHHRLSVIDLHPEANQPMRVEDGVILLNGEIYNYREIGKVLKKGPVTKSDTEAALRAFLERGVEFTKLLRGMYAMAIFHKGELHLLRDPFGKKPLYYAQKDEVFIFSSEIKAILAYFPDIGWTKDQVPSYLFCQSFISKETLYPEIRSLEPGGHLVFKNAEIDESVNDLAAAAKGSAKIAPKRVAKLLEESVSHRLVSDVDVGALLSGGLDSSLVAAMAQRVSSKPICTFTVGYEGYEKYDERKFALKVAEHIGSDHSNFEMGIDDFMDSSEELLAHLDEPLGDPAAIPLWFLSKKIKESGVKVLLSGDGADELFFGYRPYYEMVDIERAKELKYKNWLRNYFRANYSPNREWEWYKRIFDESILFRSSAEIFTDLQQNRLLRQNVKDDSSLLYIKRYAERFGDTTGPQWYSYIDLKVQLAEIFLKKLDRVTMAHGIEARCPFLDKKLVEEVFGSDPLWRMGSSPKWLLKEAAKGYLPETTLNRKKKGFSYPFIEWLHGSGEMERLKEINRSMALFRDDALEFLIEKSKKGRFKHHMYAIWHLCRWIEKRQCSF
ncbi:MAG: asparagine synthase (glutamine-hydrolyzing) [Hydrogenimonas sp.]|nr:asparagine synthase (glutamine-hydrolyzing) [Hydrogenimonas sp.]